MIDLQKCRDEIDSIDQELVALLQKRMKVSEQVAASKRETGKKIFDPVREDEILKKRSAMAEDEFGQQYLTELFTQIMSTSRKLQYSLNASAKDEIELSEAIQSDGSKNIDRIGIRFVIPHVSGALYRILSHLVFYHLNMTRIESEPLTENEYRFFVEFEGSLSMKNVRNALTGIAEEASQFQIVRN